MRTSPEFWIEHCDDPDTELMSPGDIEAFNRNAFEVDDHLVDPARLPNALPGREVESRIRAISQPGDRALFDADGRRLGDEDWSRLQANCGFDRLKDRHRIEFAMVRSRADMRTWPTDDVVIASEDTRELDRFQENALFPGDIVAILHTSTDERWHFVQSYNYAAWVRRRHLVVGDLEAMLEFRDAADALVVTGDSVGVHDGQDVVSLDMGVRLPLAAPANAVTPFHVRLPVAGRDGSLQFETATIEPTADVRVGYLPFTRRHVIQQAFKFLGEPYGWGHSRNARDCTGFVSEIFRTMGFVMPRNSAQQADSAIGVNTRFATDTPKAEKLELVRRADVGDLLYSIGHVMMYLGSVDDQPWVIHDLAGAGWMDDAGHYRERAFSGVSATPLIALFSSRDVTYLDQMYAIKSMRTRLEHHEN